MQSLHQQSTSVKKTTQQTLLCDFIFVVVYCFSSSCWLIVLCSFLFIILFACLCLNVFYVFFITSFLFIYFKHRLSRYSLCGHCIHQRTHMNHQISRPISPEPPSNCVSANDIPIATAKSIKEKKGIYFFLLFLV